MEAERFDLALEMVFDAEAGIADLDRHLTQIKASADALGFAFDRHLARNELQAATFRGASGQIRLLLARGGAMAIELRRRPEAPKEPVKVAVLPLPLAADDPRLRHRTTNRFALDEARNGSGAFEVLFVDGEGFLTQGSFSHLFVRRSGKLLTPPLSRPMANGVLRARLIEQGEAEEAELRPGDLDAGFLIGNSVMGLIEAAPV